MKAVKDVVVDLEKKHNQILPVGVCHPGVHSPQTGLVKNAPNCVWIEKQPFQKSLREALNREVFCENDGNCFALSESIDGAGKHYKIVYGIILGSGAGGGLVIDKQIVSGPNGVAGEWGHNQLPFMAAQKEELKTSNLREAEVESFVSGLGLAKRFNKKYKIAIGITLSLALLLLLGSVIISRIISQKVVQLLEDQNVENLHISIEKTKFSLFDRSLVFTDVHLSPDDDAMVKLQKNKLYSIFLFFF